MLIGAVWVQQMQQKREEVLLSFFILKNGMKNKKVGKNNG